jgi:hypothetical protein
MGGLGICLIFPMLGIYIKIKHMRVRHMSNPPIFYFDVNCKCGGGRGGGFRHMSNPKHLHLIAKNNIGRLGISITL